MLNEEKLEKRLYQENIVKSAQKGNTLVVAPTALGKTVIAIMLSAKRLEKYPESKILMLSPTRPLVNQHLLKFREFLKIPEEKIVSFSGTVPPEKRAELWKKAKIICSTPQVIENDIISGKYDLKNISLLIFDEAHRAVGDYPYSFIAKEYIKTSRYPLILGLTASPGGEEEKIREVCKNLFIENIEVRTERDKDVRPYIKGIKVEWVRVKLPIEFKKIKDLLEDILKEKIKEIKKLGFTINKPSKKELLKIREEIIKKNGKDFHSALISISLCINLAHALELLETQGLETLKRYFERLERSKSKTAKKLIEDSRFLRAIRLTENLSEEFHHPKLEKLIQIIKKEKGKKIIVFTQYRDSSMKIVDALGKIEGIKPVRFVGQSSRDGDKGLTQKQQLEIIEKFKKGEYNVLVATSVAEEGLDIPKVDIVIFYEPIPSEIRSIQRRGRTGRGEMGRVIVLITENTRDEAFYWSSYHKEKKMREILNSIKSKFSSRMEIKQRNLHDFLEAKYYIYVDSRELASSIPRELINYGIISKPKKLPVGDYIIGENIGIERKSVSDFLQSIVDGRLLDQAIRMKKTFKKPLIIIEGEGLYTKRDIHPNAVMGALISIAIDIGVPIIFTKNEKETASLIANIVRREHEKDKIPQIRHEKKLGSLKEMQEFIVAGLPFINLTLARRLLEKFKTVENIFTATEDELSEVRGIGKKIAQEIRKVVSSEYIP
ncbi:MAG: hypothetical protein DRN25_02715 [Thermoplasmata archaeon]|nr:MAG: hypothetical protein DRN25_02715 [Thermoplasmata archaeon]